MKTSNDKKQPNPKSGSLGQLLRSRERLVHAVWKGSKPYVIPSKSEAKRVAKLKEEEET